MKLKRLVQHPSLHFWMSIQSLGMHSVLRGKNDRLIDGGEMMFNQNEELQQSSAYKGPTWDKVPVTMSGEGSSWRCTFLWKGKPVMDRPESLLWQVHPFLAKRSRKLHAILQNAVSPRPYTLAIILPYSSNKPSHNGNKTPMVTESKKVLFLQKNNTTPFIFCHKPVLRELLSFHSRTLQQWICFKFYAASVYRHHEKNSLEVVQRFQD